MLKVGHVPDGKTAPGAAGFVSPPKQLPLQSADELTGMAKIDDAIVVSATKYIAVPTTAGSVHTGAGHSAHIGAAPPAPPYVSVYAVAQAQHCVQPTTPVTSGAEQ
jgi:hypothetical protein